MISLKSNPWQVHTAHLQFHWKCINKKTHMGVKVDGESTYQQALSILLPCPTTYIQVTKSWYKVVLRFTQSFKGVVFTKIWKLLYMFSNDGVLRRALLGTWSAWGTLEDWGELEGCTLWRLLETLCSPGWQISTRNYIFIFLVYPCLMHLNALFWPRTYIHLLHRCFKSEQNNQRLGFFSFTLQAGYSTSI